MDTKKELDAIINRILACSDSRYITEIYAYEESFINGEPANKVYLMVETELSFTNTDLYDTLNDLEDEIHSFILRISVEPDAAERGHGIVLWKQ